MRYYWSIIHGGTGEIVQRHKPFGSIDSALRDAYSYMSEEVSPRSREWDSLSPLPGAHPASVYEDVSIEVRTDPEDMVVEPVTVERYRPRLHSPSRLRRLLVEFAGADPCEPGEELGVWDKPDVWFFEEWVKQK